MIARLRLGIRFDEHAPDVDIEPLRLDEDVGYLINIKDPIPERQLRSFREAWERTFAGTQATRVVIVNAPDGVEVHRVRAGNEYRVKAIGNGGVNAEPSDAYNPVPVLEQDPREIQDEP